VADHASRHLRVHLHRLAADRDLLDTDIPANVVLGDDLLVEHRRRTLLEGVALELGAPLVGLDVAALQLRLVGGDDGNVNVASRTQIVEYTSQDGVAAQLDRVLAGQLRLPLRLEDGHGRQRARAHGHVRQLVGGAVGMDCEEVGAGRVDAGDNEVGANVTLVLEEVLLEHGHAGDDAGLAAGGQGVQLEVGRDDCRGELGIRGRSGTGTPDLGGDVVKLLAVLVGNDGAGRRSCVGGDLEPGLARGGHSNRMPCSLTTTPPSKMHPTMVVPVLVALGRGTPRAWRAALRL
jgi:hypothetical protein